MLSKADYMECINVALMDKSLEELQDIHDYVKNCNIQESNELLLAKVQVGSTKVAISETKEDEVFRYFEIIIDDGQKLVINEHEFANLSEIIDMINKSNI